MVRKRSKCGEIWASQANLGRKYYPSVEKYRIPMHATKEKTNQVWEILGVPSQDVKENHPSLGKFRGSYPTHKFIMALKIIFPRCEKRKRVT